MGTKGNGSALRLYGERSEKQGLDTMTGNFSRGIVKLIFLLSAL